jgi:hypothetical protein
MAADFNKPVLADAYASVLQSVRDLAKDLALMLDNTGTANIPAGAIKWNSTNARFEKYNGTAWAAMVSRMSQDVTSVMGYAPGNGSGALAVNNGSLNTNLNAEMVGGLRAANLSATRSMRDFTNGTLITTSIDYSVTNGDAWVIELTGNSYGDGTPFNIQLQGYIYNGAIINYSGMKLGPSPSQFVILNNGGFLCLWMPRLGYWNGFTVTAYVATTSGARTNLVTSITDTAQPAGATKVVDITSTVKTAWHSGNFNASALDMAGVPNVGAPGTYGGVTLKGVTNNYSGFRFDTTDSYLMHSAGGETGEYSPSAGVWRWRFDNGTLSAGTVPWARLSGVPSFNYLPLSGGTMSGALGFARDVWQLDSAGSQRLYFGNGHSYYKTTATNYHIFRMGGDTDVAYLANGGIWSNGYGWLHDYFTRTVNAGYYLTGGGSGPNLTISHNPGFSGSGAPGSITISGGHITAASFNCNCNCSNG